MQGIRASSEVGLIYKLHTQERRRSIDLAYILFFADRRRLSTVKGIISKNKLDGTRKKRGKLILIR